MTISAAEERAAAEKAKMFASIGRFFEQLAALAGLARPVLEQAATEAHAQQAAARAHGRGGTGR